MWYFLTGSLAKPANLRSLLKLDQDPDLRPAVVEDVCNMQVRHCNALTEACREPMWTPAEQVRGVAYLVKNAKEEQAMRLFKTDFFAALRCKIKLVHSNGDGYEEEINGLVFILMGSWSTLQNMSMPAISMHPGAVGSNREAQFNWVPVDEDKKGRASSIVLSVPGVAKAADEYLLRFASVPSRYQSI